MFTSSIAWKQPHVRGEVRDAGDGWLHQLQCLQTGKNSLPVATTKHNFHLLCLFGWPIHWTANAKNYRYATDGCNVLSSQLGVNTDGLAPAHTNKQTRVYCCMLPTLSKTLWSGLVFMVNKVLYVSIPLETRNVHFLEQATVLLQRWRRLILLRSWFVRSPDCPECE